ncbi:MAG: MarR family winged helix-turn-helix transcriptional regulator [Anaerolineaceae bacterium]
MHTKMDPNEPHIGHLVMNIARLLASRTDRSMEKFGLYRGQAYLLKILSEQDGLTHSEIARILEISPAAATKVIKRLEAHQYLERRPDSSDERISRVFLRDEGRAVIRQIHDVFQQNNLCLYGGLSPEEQVVLAGLLKKVHESLQKPCGEKV